MLSNVYILGNLQIHKQDRKLELIENIEKCITANSVCIFIDSGLDEYKTSSSCCNKTEIFEQLLDIIILSLKQYCRHVYICTNSPHTFVHNSKIFICLGKYPSSQNLSFINNVVSVAQNKFNCKKLPVILYFQYGLDDNRWSTSEKNKFITFIDNPDLLISCIIFCCVKSETSIKLLQTPNKKIPIFSATSPDCFLQINIDDHGSIKSIYKFLK